MNQAETLAFMKRLYESEPEMYFTAKDLFTMTGCNMNRVGQKLATLYRTGFLERRILYPNKHYYRYLNKKKKGHPHPIISYGN